MADPKQAPSKKYESGSTLAIMGRLLLGNLQLSTKDVDQKNPAVVAIKKFFLKLYLIGEKLLTKALSQTLLDYSAAELGKRPRTADASVTKLIADQNAELRKKQEEQAKKNDDARTLFIKTASDLIAKSMDYHKLNAFNSITVAESQPVQNEIKRLEQIIQTTNTLVEKTASDGARLDFAVIDHADYVRKQSSTREAKNVRDVIPEEQKHLLRNIGGAGG